MTALPPMIVGLIAVGLLLLPGPPRRSPYAVLARADSDVSSLRARWRLRLPLPRTAPTGSQVRLLIAQVTALLRAGAPPAAAWTRAVGVPTDAFGVPSVTALAEVVGEHSAVAVVGATRLAMTVGAPLAPALSSVCDALAAESEAEAERTAALAGPRTTARVLMCLPVLGLGIGIVLGAEPLVTATDGGIGTVCVALGLAAMATGRLWINRLVARARRVGEEAA